MKLCCITLSVALFVSGLPAISFGEEGGPFSLVNRVSAYYDSNIIGASGGDSDLEFVYAPTVTLTRRSGVIGLDANVGGAFGFFADNDRYNYEDFDSSLSLGYPSDRSLLPYSLTFDGGYSDLTKVDRYVGDRIVSETAKLSGAFRYNVNERWGLRLQSHWNDIRYRGAQLRESSTWRAGADLAYRYSEKLDFFLGYNYSETSGDLDRRFVASRGYDAIDTKDHAYRIQAEGELTPKIAGILGLGYQTRETNFDDSGDPYVNLNLTWTANERIEVVATGGIRFLTTSLGVSGRQTSAGLAATMALRQDVAASVGLSYVETAYDISQFDRTDEFFLYRGELVWEWSPSAALSALITYDDAGSELGGLPNDRLTYDRFRVGLVFKYTF